MAQLIERLGGQTVVNGNHIDLSKLICTGFELIELVESRWYSLNDDLPRYRQEAIEKARRIADEYRCQYIMLGQRPVRLVGDNILFIASFYIDKK